MGYWCTLHLFNDRKFHEELIPEMRGIKGNIDSVCKDFLECYTVGGVRNYSVTELSKRVSQVTRQINEISNSMDHSFKLHHEFCKINDFDTSMDYLGKMEGHYEFCKFLEYSIFRCCADFYPHIPLGKGGLGRNFDFNKKYKSLSFSIVNELDKWNTFFCADMMGITNWLNKEEVELLYLDRENLISKENTRGDIIYNLIEIANEYNMGLVVGIDMREDNLERLPSYKLIKAEMWNNLNTQGMLFKK